MEIKRSRDVSSLLRCWRILRKCNNVLEASSSLDLLNPIQGRKTTLSRLSIIHSFDLDAAWLKMLPKSEQRF